MRDRPIFEVEIELTKQREEVAQHGKGVNDRGPRILVEEGQQVDREDSSHPIVRKSGCTSQKTHSDEIRIGRLCKKERKKEKGEGHTSHKIPVQ